MSSQENSIEEWTSPSGCRDIVSPWEMIQRAASWNTHSTVRDTGLPLLSTRDTGNLPVMKGFLFSAQHAFCSERGKLKGGSVLKDLRGNQLPSLWGNNKEDHLYSTKLFKILPPWNSFSISSLFALHWDDFHKIIFIDSSLLYNNIFDCYCVTLKSLKHIPFCS